MPCVKLIAKLITCCSLQCHCVLWNGILYILAIIYPRKYFSCFYFNAKFSKRCGRLECPFMLFILTLIVTFDKIGKKTYGSWLAQLTWSFFYLFHKPIIFAVKPCAWAAQLGQLGVSVFHVVRNVYSLLQLLFNIYFYFTSRLPTHGHI